MGGSGRETPGPTQAEPQSHSALPYIGSQDKGGSHGLLRLREKVLEKTLKAGGEQKS